MRGACRMFASPPPGRGSPSTSLAADRSPRTAAADGSPRTAHRRRMMGLTADAARLVAERPPVADWEAALTGPGSDYARLSRSVRAAGLLRRRPGYYSIKIAVNLLLLAAGWAAFFLLGRSWWQLLVAVFLAVRSEERRVGKEG